MTEAATCAINVAYADKRPAGLPIALGVPFPNGALTDASVVSVSAPSGERRPTACRPLVKWPDGSIRWGLVSFGARETGVHRVTTGSASPAPEEPVTVTQQGHVWTIDNGRLRVTLGETGPGIIHRIECDGHTYLEDPSKLALCVDHASTRHEASRSIRVLEQSPLRVRVRVEGAHYTARGERKLSYRLDVELWTGWTTLRLDYHFFNLEPGRPSVKVDRLACDTEWLLPGPTERHFLQREYGLFYVSRHVFNPDPVAIITDEMRGSAYVEDPAMLLDDLDYPFYLHPPLVSTRDWLGVNGSGRAVYMQMQEFTRMRPNRITSEASSLNIELWPSVKEPLDLPQGRSRRHVIALAFVESEEAQPERRVGKMVFDLKQPPKGVEGMLAALWYEDRACVTPEWFAHCGEFEQDRVLPMGRHARIESSIRGMMGLSMPNTKFDVGDTPEAYNSSYAATDERLVPLLPGAPHIPRVWPSGSPTQTYLDCHEAVWSNNEYDGIHALANEAMRTGRYELLSTLRLAARHNIEVDFLHYSDHKWLHRATPAHSARHTTTGAYPSHLWTQGLLEYYCLTGDPDALEVALALGDKIIEFFQSPEQREVLWGFNREVGWAILALVHLYDITREERFRPLLDEIVDYLVAFDREAFTGAVNLSGGNALQSLNRQIVGNFDVEEWLKKLCYDLARESLNAVREGNMLDVRLGLAYSVGYERTGDERFLVLMGVLLDQLYWNAQGPGRSHGLRGLGSTYRGFTRMLGHAHRHGSLKAYEFPSLSRLNE